MKLYSPILLCTPALARQSADGKLLAVHELNVSTAFTLPPTNVTEGMFTISIGETGKKEGYYVNMRHQGEKKKNRLFHALGWTTGAAVVGGGISYMAAVAAIATGAAVLAVPAAIIMLLAVFLAKDSVKLQNKKHSEWQVIDTPTSIPGTFQLETTRNDGTPRVLDAQLLGLKHSPSTWALRAREVDDSLIHLQSGEKIVVLQFIDLTNNEAHWLAKKGSRLVLSGKKVTAFKFSPSAEMEVPATSLRGNQPN